MTRKAHDNGRKIYVLDTNILLSSPNAIFGFDNNVVVIAATTLQELDLKKTVPGEIGFNAREAGRHIEELRVKGKEELLKAGITTPIVPVSKCAEQFVL